MSDWQPVKTMPETGKFLVLFQTGRIELWDKPENPEDDPHRISDILKSNFLIGWMPISKPPANSQAARHYKTIGSIGE